MSINKLIEKTSIYNFKCCNEFQSGLWKNIRECYEKCYEVDLVTIFMDCAAECRDLRIVFDFEHENLFHEGRQILRSTNSNNCIYIQAKNYGQDIKGIIAFELCHYIIRMIYQNYGKPYFANDFQNADDYEKIVEKIRNAAKTKPQSADDQEYDDETHMESCRSSIALSKNMDFDEVLSSVFDNCCEYDFPVKLIPRLPQILAHFDNKKLALSNFEHKYEPLCRYFKDVVIEDVKLFVKMQNLSRSHSVNGNVKCLDLKSTKNVSLELKSSHTIFKSNIPKLLLVNIHNHLQNLHDESLDKAIFMSIDALQDQQAVMDISKVLWRKFKLNFIIDCSKGFCGLEKLNLLDSTCKFVLIVPNHAKLNEVKPDLRNILKPMLEKSSKINFQWNDLKEKSQELLLQTEVLFQNNLSVTLQELISMANSELKLEEIVDEPLLNLLIERSEISINKETVDETFKSLYMPRTIIKNGTAKLSELEFIEDNKNQSFIILSDKIGTGKSWMLRNTAINLREKNPQRWTTYVDLRKFVKEFKEHKMEPNFLQFFTEEILSKKPNFEKKIFENFYKSGKVSILFTGFEAIPAKCLQFVTKLAESIKLTNGNQVWIGSADYFEDFLKQILNLKTIYKLEKLTESESVELVASYCLLNDIEDDNNQKRGLSDKNPLSSQLSKDNPQLENDPFMIANAIQKTKIFKNYLFKAEHIMDKDKTLKLDMPAFYKAIADFMSSDQEPRILEVYYAFLKSKLRKYSQNVTESHSNLSKIHQYYGMKSYFPDDRPSNNWQAQQVIQFGILTKIGENYEFVHETYREYFAAEFIVQTMKAKSEIDGDFCKQLLEVLTVQKFVIVRMLLNEALNNFNIKEVENNFKEFYEDKSAIINQIDNISLVFQENLDNLATLVIHFLNKGNYDTVKQIISKNVSKIIKNSKMFLKYHQFLVKFLQPEDYKELIISQHIVQTIVSSKIKIKDFEQILMEIEGKISKAFVIKALTSTNSDGENLFVLTEFESSEFDRFIYILMKFLNKEKILELMKNCNKNGQNILEVAVSAKNAKKLEMIWKNVENFCRIFESPLIFKELVSSLQNEAANCKELEIHESVWTLLRNSVDLREFLLQKDNFVHLVVISDHFEVIKFTINKIKENFENSEEILQSRDRNNRNLLQTAVSSTKSIQNLQFLWAVLRDLFECDSKFLEFFKSCDSENKHVLHLAASFGTYETLEFIMEMLEKATTRDEIKNLIAQKDNLNTNILQLAVKFNKSFKVHQHSWKILQKYFTEHEILEFLINLDSDGNSVCKIASNCDARDFIKLINGEREFLHHTRKPNKWKMHSEFDSNDSSDDDDKGNSPRDKIDDLEISLCLKNLSLLEETKNNFSKSHLDSLHRVAKSNRVHIHKILWYNILRNYEDTKKLLEILMGKNEDGNNFLHIVVVNCARKVWYFTFRELWHRLLEEDCPKIIKSKGYNGRNILQLAACNLKGWRPFDILWNNIERLLPSEDEFLELLKEVDNDGNGIFQLAVSFGNFHVVDFLIENTKENFTAEQFKEMLNNLNHSKQNILQSALIHNRSIELHEFLWKVIVESFNLKEVKFILKHKDESDCNAFLCAVTFSPIYVIDITWNKMKNCLLNQEIPEDFELVKILQQCNRNGQNFIHICIEKQNLQLLKLIKAGIREFFLQFKFADNFKDLVLQTTQINCQNILHLAANCDAIELHEILWDILLESCKENPQELENFLIQRDKDGHNFMDILDQTKNTKTMEFTVNLIKQNFKNSVYQKILNTDDTKLIKLNFVSLITKDNDILDAFLNCLTSSEFLVQNLRDSSGQNLLNLSIIRGQFDATRKLLNFNFNLDFECYGKRAIDYAWKSFINSKSLEGRANYSQITLSLLKKNSRFPSVDFEYKTVSKDIRIFIDTCRSIHNAVRNNKVQEIVDMLKTEPTLCHFYDTSNQSLLSHAIKVGNMKICKILIKSGLRIGSHEHLTPIYRDLSENKRKLLRKFNLNHASQSSKKHISALISKSTIYPSNQQKNENWQYIKEAFEILDQDITSSLILQTAAKWSKLKISFDFTSSSVYYLDPSASMDTMSASYPSGDIIFGTKDIKDEFLRKEVICSLIHEMCHVAILMTFMNRFNPYPAGETEMKDRFEDVVDECVEHQEHDKIIETALRQKNVHAELIVTAIQIIMSQSLFGQEELLKKQKKFGKLFKYFKSVVAPEMKQALKVLKDLEDNKKDLAFKNLTNPMKSKVIHSNVKFQGTNTTFFNIIENSTDILNNITSKDIRGIILGNKTIEIGQNFQKDSKVKNKLQKFTNMETIDENVKILIRSDSKNTQILNKFEEQLKNFWISCIKLTKHRTAFESFMAQDELNSDKLREFLLSIFNLKSQLEIEIFNDLFNKKKLVLLIYAEATNRKTSQKNFNIIKFLYEFHNCKLWVLIEPQCIKHYEEFLVDHLIDGSQTIEEENSSDDEEFYDFDDDAVDVVRCERELMVYRWNPLDNANSEATTKWRNGNKIIYWKVTGNNKIYYLKFDDDIDGKIQEFCKNFIYHAEDLQLIDNLPTTELITSARFDDLKDKNGINLLTFAVKQNNSEIIDKLLNFSFDLDHTDIHNKTTIDHAWESYENAKNSTIKTKISRIILKLLQSNSKFPSKKFGFRYEKLSEELLKFVDISEQMHRDIEQNNIEHVKILLNQNPNLRYFYDRTNATALMYALKRNRHNILDVLHGELSVRHDENLSLVYCDYPMYRSTAFSDNLRLPKSHILMLKSKTKISVGDSSSQEIWKMIENIYKKIEESSEICSKVLKIAAILDGLQIFFDFRNDYEYFTETRVMQSRTIIIGAKDFFTGKSKLISTLIRMFCQVAVEVSCLDYFGMNLPAEATQKCENLKPQNEFDLIVKTVINSYPKSEPNFDLCNHFTQIDEIELIYIIRMLQDGTKNVEFRDLTEPMKLKVQNSQINFQGIETSFSEIIENDKEILKVLPSDWIKNSILEKNRIEIGQKLSVPESYVDRKFVDSQNFKDLAKNSKLSKNFDQIRTEVETYKIVVLEDLAGTGKSTSLAVLANKLKEFHKNAWISFIKVRNNRKFLQKDVNLKLLMDVSNITTKIEQKIFTKMFENCQIILFIDGFDEIDYGSLELLLKLANVRNIKQIWISTRPQTVSKLEDCKFYKFAPLTVDERNDLILMNLKTHSEIPQDLQSLFNVLEHHQNIVSNPLMIQVITQLFVENKIKLDKKSFNFYATFDTIHDAHKLKLCEKLETYHHDFNSVKQVLAIKFIFGHQFNDKLGFNIDDLAIVKNWTREKPKFTSEKIRKYGFVVVDLKSEENCIEFIHKSYAEFFIAEFIISFLFNYQQGLIDEEYFKVFNILRILKEKPEYFKNILTLIFDYSKITEVEIHKSMRNLINNYVLKFNDNDEFFSSLLKSNLN